MSVNLINRSPAVSTPSSGGELFSIMQRDDTSIGEIVRQRLPSGSYTSVYVASLDAYNFAGISTMPTRLISLSVSKGHYCSSILYAIFSGIGIIKSQHLEGTIDKSKLHNQLIQHICGEPGEAEQIEKAYTRCTDMDLYIAMDLSAIELKLRESHVIMGVYKVTGFLAKVLPVLVPLLLGNQAPINQ